MRVFSERTGYDHFLTTVDGRIKVLLAGLVLLLILSSRGFFFPLAVLGASLLLCLHMRVRGRALLLRFSEPLLVAFVIVLIKFFFSGQEPLFTLALPVVRVCGYREGLIEGLSIAARIGGAVSAVSLLSFATPFTDMLSALSWLRIPKGLTDTLMFAYRYIFMLSDEAMVIYSAQKNRLGYSTLRRGMNSFGILAGSLTLRAFEHSQNTAAAMAQRGYDGTIPLTRHRPVRRAEVIGSILVALAMVLLWKI